MSPSTEQLTMEPASTDQLQEQSEKREAAKARRPREEIPEFEDPSAELAKINVDGLVKPDRTKIDDKIWKKQEVIDSHKTKIAGLTKQLDNIKEANQKRKAQGSGDMEKARGVIRDIKSRIVATIEEKKKITATIEASRSSERAAKDQLKAARASVGNFRSNEAIDDEIARIQDVLHHQTNTLKEEKAMMLRIKEIEACRGAVKVVESLEATAGTMVTGDLSSLYDARTAKNEILDGLKVEEAAAVAVLEGLREKRDKEIASNNFSELFDQRNALRDEMTQKINEIKEIRTEFRQVEDEYYKTDRLVRELKRQITKKNRAERDARRAEQGDAYVPEDGEEVEEEEEEGAEPKEKMMDYDMSQRIITCEQLVTFLKQYKPKEASAVAAPKAPSTAGKMNSLKDLDDPLGLNAFMVDEAVSSKKKKKDKKKAKNNAKASLVPEEGEVVTLQLSLEVMHNFSTLSLPTPVNSNDVDASIEGLLAKKAYYEEKGKNGMTLKELLKEEKEARLAAKQQAQDQLSGAAAKKAAEEAAAAAKEAAKAAAEEEAMRKMAEQEAAEAARVKAEKAAAEAAKQAAEEEAQMSAMLEAEEKAKKKAAAEKAKEKKRLAEEAAAAEPQEFDLAAARKAAQGKELTEAEKKERGLLYDKSIASAVRDDSEEEDDEGADLAGGFDWDAGFGEEEEEEAPMADPFGVFDAPEEKKLVDPVEDKFEAYLREQGLDVDGDEEEEEETHKKGELEVKLDLQKDGTVACTIKQW